MSGDNSSNKMDKPNPESPNKKKSIGFIETSGFKPNWLETGPLSPDMLPTKFKETTPSDIPPPTVDKAGNNQIENKPPAVTEKTSAPSDNHSTQTTIVSDQKEQDSQPQIDGLPTSMNVPRQSNEEAIFEPVREGVSTAVPVEEVKNAPVQEEIKPAPVVVPTSSRVNAEKPTGIKQPAYDPYPSAQSRSVTSLQEKPKKHRDKLFSKFLFLSLLFSGLAILLYLFNPLSRLAMATGSLARPVNSTGLATPRTIGGDWCVIGDFTASADSPLTLNDRGTQGDILPDDGIYSLDYSFSQPGTYQWGVVNCADPSVAYPAEGAWLTTDRPNQNVTFFFDTIEREDRLFYPISYVVSAIDSSDNFKVVGSFQDWDLNDTSSSLEEIGTGFYQQIRQIARSGNYEGYIIDTESQKAIDAYGRTNDPIPFAFETTRNGEHVVFLYDTDRGRASVVHRMNPYVAEIAFGGGNTILSFLLAAIAGLLLLGLLLRLIIFRNRRFWLESGCPHCGQHELMRTSRKDRERRLNSLDIPAYRYRCRNCTWEGTRLSEGGTAVSPGLKIASTDVFK